MYIQIGAEKENGYFWLKSDHST